MADEIIEADVEPYLWAEDDDERRRAFVIDRLAIAAAHWDRPDDVLELMRKAYEWLKENKSPVKLRSV